jgi:hypothetical protein
MPTKEMRPGDIKVHAWDIIRMIPDEDFAKLARDSKVDYCAKVLTGERVFYLLLYSLLASKEISQRNLSVIFNNSQFKTLFNVADGASVTHSSISSRLAKIDLGFFQKTFEMLYDKLSSLYTENEIRDKHLIRVDSSMVAETCNKLKEGMTMGKKSSKVKEDRKQLKYTMAYDGFAVQCAKVFDSPSFISEDLAMPAVLNDLIRKDKDHKNLYVLDRGLSSLTNYKSISDQDAKFVGRIKTNRKMEVVKSLLKEDTDKDLDNLTLKEDMIVHLYDGEKKAFSEQEFRVVKAEFKVLRDTTRPANKGRVKRVENDIFFITNDFDLSPQEIAEAYHKRWDIEVFFRFLKQNLCFSHFLSTSDNGVQVMLYMTLIASMLIMIYKRENEALYDGERVFWYSNAKFSFYMEITEWVNQLSIIINGGDSKAIYKTVVIRTRIP